MFENYVGAKTEKMAPWKIALISGVVLLHATLGVVMLIKSFWTIEKLTPPDSQVSFGMAPPPPPPPPAGSSKPKSEQKKVVRKVTEPVQPDKTKEIKPSDADKDSENEGVEGGVEGGVVGGEVGGVVGGVIGGTGTEPVPAPPPPEPPKLVPQQATEALRISGEKDIQPPNDVNVAIRRAGTRVTGAFQMCLKASGAIDRIIMKKSTGYPGYDAKIRSKMNEWKYRPFMVNGKATPVCTSVVFIYTPSA